MATVASVLDGMRYDLRNYGDFDFDIDLLVHYLNRALKILDQRLVSMNSDQLFTQGNVTQADEANYATCPTGCLAIREAWISQDRKTNVSMAELYYRRQFRTGDEAEPNFWTHVQNQIQFEVPSDQEYTIKLMYDKASTALVAGGSTMPFNDVYNDILREVTIQMCIHKKYKKDSQTDAVYAQIFDQMLQMDMVNRTWVKKEYKLDF